MIAKRPVTFFLLFTFLISYLVGLPFNMFVSGLISKENEVLSVLMPRLVTVYGPAAGAITVCWASAGRQGVIRLLVKLRPTGKHVSLSLLVAILLSGLTLAAYRLAGLPFVTIAGFISKDWPLLAGQLGAQFLIVGIGEEIGWRGWLLPRLLENNSFPAAIGWLTLSWAVWHLPILFRGFQIVYPWLMILVSMSLIMSCLWIKVKGNVLVLAMAHAGANAPQAFMENRMIEAHMHERYLTDGWQALGFMYLSMALVVGVLAYGSGLFKRHIDDPVGSDQHG